MYALFRFLEYGIMLGLMMLMTDMFAQENQKQQDTSNSVQNVSQRPLPKFDLPEYVITGIGSVDLPKLEKISFEDDMVSLRPTMKSFGKNQQDHETVELEIKNRLNDSQTIVNRYSGFVQAGIGTYFTPHAELGFGQTLKDFHYVFGGMYHLTNGYAENTGQSGGGLRLAGGTSLVSTVPILRNAVLDGSIGYRSESFHFYGSASPTFQRTISHFRLQANLENQAAKDFPYAAGISVGNLNISDSSMSKNETLLDLNFQTTLPVASLPLQTKLHWMSTTVGVGYLDLSGGVQNYGFAGMLFRGSLHLYWASGMSGQNIVRLRPHLTASYQATSEHRIYVSYEPMVVPMMLASNIEVNRFLSTASTVRHADVTNAGELGIESEWNDAMRSRVSFSVKSIQDLGVFLDSSRQGVWTLAYGGRTTIVTISAEMFAKLESNDYFASNITLRSTKDSFWGSRIPYAPAIDGGCYVHHRFGAATVASLGVRFMGERKTDLYGKTAISGYAVVDVSCEYTPFDFLRLSIGIKNLTDARYEIWRGYQEYPLTMYAALQVKW